MSGAGRTTAAHCFEDFGWYVVDNLPLELLPSLAELGQRAGGTIPRLAVIVDVRAWTFHADLHTALQALGELPIQPRIVFLEATDEVLVRRFESVRRPHPLQDKGRVLDGIRQERHLLHELRQQADVVIDTSHLNVHQLSAKIMAAFATTLVPQLRATVMSFGYKYGLPLDADLVVDCRFLPNPHWVPQLRAQTGQDAAVRDYVLSQPNVEQFLQAYTTVLSLVTEGYLREAKRYATIAVGCTGGKHRSVAIAEELTKRLQAMHIQAHALHRDVGRE
jgi:UPF0042 nucleotide-binding protein